MTANDSVEWLHRRGLGEYEGWRARGLPEVGAAVLAQSGRVIGAADGDSLLSRRGARAPQAGGGAKGVSGPAWMPRPNRFGNRDTNFPWGIAG